MHVYSSLLAATGKAVCNTVHEDLLASSRSCMIGELCQLQLSYCNLITKLQFLCPHNMLGVDSWQNKSGSANIYLWGCTALLRRIWQPRLLQRSRESGCALLVALMQRVIPIHSPMADARGGKIPEHLHTNRSVEDKDDDADNGKDEMTSSLVLLAADTHSCRA